MQKSSATPVRTTRLLALIAIGVALVALCLLIAVPFLPAITWGVALAIIAWPLHRALVTRFPYPKIVAGVTTAFVTLLITSSCLLVLFQIVNETSNAADHFTESADGQNLHQKLSEIPVANRAVEWMDRAGVDIETAVRSAIAENAQGLTAIAQGSLAAVIQCLVAVFLLYYLFLDRLEFVNATRRLLPLSREETDQVLRVAADAVQANVYANVVTSAIDATGFGLLFWVLGLPAPALWGAVMFILSLLPMVGAGFVWFPTVVFLALSQRFVPALTLLAWGAFTFVAIDNILYVRLAGKSMRMHPAVAMIAFLGGIAIFGVSGMILGPTIVAIAAAFLDVWKQRVDDSGSPAVPSHVPARSESRQATA